MSKLRELRKENCYTQSDMATKIGLKSKNAYSLKERGKRKFSLEEANQISLIFGHPIEEIFFDNEVIEMSTGNKAS